MSNLQKEFDKFKGQEIKTVQGPKGLKELDPSHPTAKDFFDLAAKHNINTVEIAMRGSPRPGNSSSNRARITLGYKPGNIECIADIEIG